MPFSSWRAGEPARRAAPGRGFRCWTIRWVLGLSTLVVALVALGSGYEAVMVTGDTSRYPPAGQLVDVGGYRLHLHCEGTGTPTVIMEAGGGGNVLHWMQVQSEIAHATRVCSYDRAGMGWSEPGPQPRTPERIVRELHTLLENAGIPGPYIMVGHSIGGKYVRLHASQYPQDVVGMVLVDARHEDVDAAMTPDMRAADQSNAQRARQIYWVAGRLGLMRLFAPGPSSIPLDTRRMIDVLSSRPQALATQYEEHAVWADSDSVLRAAPALGRIPLVVLSSGLMAERDPVLRTSMRTQASLSSNSLLIIATDSGHPIQFDQPELVTDAVRQVLDSVRTGRVLKN